MEKNDSIVFTPELVSKVGEIGKVLGAFLENQTTRIQGVLSQKYPEVQSTSIKKLLNEFVTLEGTKRPLSKGDIRVLTLTQTQIDLCLKELEKARILRLEEGVYELAHDTLALRIVEDRSTEDIAFLEILKLVNDRYRSFNTSKTLLNANEVALVNANKKRLLEDASLGEHEWAFVNKSVREIRKKRLLFSVIIIGIIGVLSLFSIFSYQQRRIAQAKEQEALVAKQEAESNLQQLKEEQKQRTAAQYEQYLANGKALMAQNKYLEAIREFNNALSFNKDGQEALSLKSEAENKTGAKQLFEQLIKEGDQLSNQGPNRYVNARNKYQAALKTGYNNNLASSKMNSLKPKLEEAFSDFKKKGDTFFNANGYDLALDFYQKALRIKPGDQYIQKQISACRTKL